MTETIAALTCPKCGGSMRSYERNGIVVDQCGECRGVFLDRGELERLIEAENAYYRPVAPAPDAGPAGSGPYGGRDRGAGYADRSDRRRYDDDRWDDDDDRGRGRGGFLGGLLDFD